MDFPSRFNSQEDRILYLELFEKNLDLSHDLLCLVMYKIYGPDFSFHNLDGKTLSVIYDIANSISYATHETICQLIPEYKTEPLFYASKDTIKQTIADVLVDLGIAPKKEVEQDDHYWLRDE